MLDVVRLGLGLRRRCTGVRSRFYVMIYNYFKCSWEGYWFCLAM